MTRPAWGLPDGGPEITPTAWGLLWDCVRLRESAGHKKINLSPPV